MFVEEAPDAIYKVLAPQTGTGHRILIPWTLAVATYLVKIPPRKERLGTLLFEITNPNNVRLITMETKGKRKKVIDVGSVSPRLGNISRATGEEPKASMSTASAKDGKKPDPMKIRKSGPRLNNKTRMGKRERGRPRRQWERDIRDAFNSSITEAGRWALDRSRFHCVVEDACPLG